MGNLQLTCLCGKSYSARVTDINRGGGKFCSISCGNKYRQRTPRGTNCTCAQCGAVFYSTKSRHKNSKSGLRFCSRSCKDAAQRIGGIKEIQPYHYGTSKGRERYKHWIEGQHNCCCVGCGENKRYQLQVHHIDGDHSNNDVDNLEIVCCNCHNKRHLRLENGVWIRDTKSLTPRHLLSEL